MEKCGVLQCQIGPYFKYFHYTKTGFKADATSILMELFLFTSRFIDMSSHNSQTNFANYVHLLSMPGNINALKIMGNSASFHYDITCVHMHMHRLTFVAQFFLT